MENESTTSRSKLSRGASAILPRVLLVGVLLLSTVFAHGCAPQSVTTVRPDRLARAFLSLLDQGRFMEAYLLTGPKYRGEMPFPVFVSRMRARRAQLGASVQRRGRVKYPATGPRCTGFKGDWIGEFTVRGKIAMREKVAVFNEAGQYRVVRYEVRPADPTKTSRSTSENAFVISPADIAQVTRLTRAVVARVEKGPLMVDGLYIQKANPVAGKSPRLLRKFMTALRKRNTVALRRMTGFGIKPRDAWRFRLLDMRYLGVVKIEDPELGRFISHMHIYSGRWRRSRQTMPGVLAVFENGDRTKINAVDLYGYEWNERTAYLLLPRKAYLGWADAHLKSAVVLKRKQQARYARWLRRQAWLKKQAKKKKEAEKKKGAGGGGGDAGGGDAGGGEKPPEE